MKTRSIVLIVAGLMIIGLVLFFLLNSKKSPSQSTAGPSDRRELASNALTAALPQENLHYKLTYTNNASGQIVYQLTLYAIINRPDEFAAYQVQLKQYKQEAFGFIRSKGMDPSKLTIEFTPPEAKNL